SKVSRWLAPPSMKSQITLFALAGNAGSSGAVGVGRARATPSSKSMAPRTAPVNPMPRSLRNCRRVTRWQPARGHCTDRMLKLSSTNRDEVIVIQESVYEVFAGSLMGIDRGSDGGKRACDTQDKRQAGHSLRHPGIDLRRRRRRGVRRQARRIGQELFL